MEPQFMIIGHAAGVAAALAVTEATAVQDVDPAALNRKLRADGAILDLSSAPPEPPAPPVPHAPAFEVVGAGDPSSNGLYKFDSTQRRDQGTGGSSWFKCVHALFLTST